MPFHYKLKQPSLSAHRYDPCLLGNSNLSTRSVQCALCKGKRWNWSQLLSAAAMEGSSSTYLVHRQSYCKHCTLDRHVSLSISHSNWESTTACALSMTSFAKRYRSLHGWNPSFSLEDVQSHCVGWGYNVKHAHLHWRQWNARFKTYEEAPCSI